MNGSGSGFQADFLLIWAVLTHPEPRAQQLLFRHEVAPVLLLVSAFSLDCKTNALLGLSLRFSPFLVSSLQLLCMDSVAGFSWEVKHVLG